MTAYAEAERAVVERRSTWSERNQQWLVAAIAELRERLDARVRRAGDAPDVTEHCVDRDVSATFTPALVACADLFGLTPFERELLLLTAGTELDQGLRGTVANVNGGTSAAPNFSLALAALTQPHWDALSPDAPLRYWQLIDLETVIGAPLARAPLRIDERILHFISGVSAEDAALLGIVRRVAVPDDDEESVDEELAERAARAFETADEGVTVVAHSEQADASVLREFAVGVARRVGRSALWISGSDLPGSPGELARLARRISREGALSDSLPLLVVDAGSVESTLVAFSAAMRGPLLWIGAPLAGLRAREHERKVVRFELPPFDVQRTRAAGMRRCRHVLEGAPSANADSSALMRELERSATQFQLGPAGIDDVVERLLSLSPDQRCAAVWASAREAARGGLESLAQRVVSNSMLADVVLPSAQLAMLRDITRQLRNRERVYREWGFAARHPRSQGMAALFWGESGTGKTLAAEAIANEAELDLYRIDLATVVSKYIGETEKNLKRLFDAAESSGAVLLFDEADALFGKRSEVKDSHDRYANIEIAYLLQRVEAYRGLAILTTNMKSALDRAFLRRIRFVVHFPFPDATAREQLWRREFPSSTPLGDIDFAALARLNLSGGSIQSVVLNAAFKAADETGRVDQNLIAEAARAELAKLERSLNPPNLG